MSRTAKTTPIEIATAMIENLNKEKIAQQSEIDRYRKALEYYEDYENNAETVISEDTGKEYVLERLREKEDRDKINNYHKYKQKVIASCGKNRKWFNIIYDEGQTARQALEDGE